MAASKSPADRGKEAEKAVQKFLTDLSNRVAQFDFSRIYDARSAGGKFPSRPGDFEFYRKMFDGSAVNGLIEVKEVAHDYRLPAKNFKPGQLGKLRKRQLAGGRIIVLVKHTPTGRWRRPEFDWLWERSGDPSFDLRDFCEYGTLEAALNNVTVMR
jgi:hypothetical protein